MDHSSEHPVDSARTSPESDDSQLDFDPALMPICQASSPADVSLRPALTLIRDLKGLGLDETVISGLARTIGATLDQPLTRFQAEVLSDPIVSAMTGNVLVAGPTSAGKTFVASVVATLARKRRPQSKVIYVVPLRALVTEKAQELRTVFAGARVLPASSDYPRSEHFARQGAWDVAVVVFEKLYQWLSEPELSKLIVPQLSLVVLDELQVVGESGRGERLEMAVTLLRHYQKHNQHRGSDFSILGMGVSREIASNLAEWLHANIVPRTPVARPVPLFEAIVRKKTSWSARQEGTKDVLSEDRLPAAIPALLRDAPGLPLLVERAVRSGLRVLVYCAGRRDATETARFLSRRFDSYPIHPSLGEELEQLEDSPVVGELRVLLPTRVGVHHGHMSSHERAIVENGFRTRDADSPIRVVVATRTLAMGVNLPADIVVFKDVHTGRGAMGSATEHAGAGYVRPLTVAEYRNLAGRAGRLRPGLPETAFGLIVLYRKRGQWQGIPEELLDGDIEPVRSALLEPEFGWGAHAISALAFHDAFYRSGRAADRLAAVLTSSYICATTGAPPNPAQDLERLQALGVATDDALTGAGNAISKFGLSTGTIEMLVAIAGNLGGWWPNRKLALLDALFGSAELGKFLRPPLSLDPQKSVKDLKSRTREIFSYFTSYLDASELIPGTPLFEWLRGSRRSKPGQVDVIRFTKAVALRQWSEGVTPRQLTEYVTPELEKELRGESHSLRRARSAFNYVTVGQLSDAAEMATALLGAIRRLYEQLNTHLEPEEIAERSRALWVWEQSIRNGVPLDRVAIPIVVSHATNERLRRSTINELFEAMGRPRDPRGWLGRAAPIGIKARVWAVFQSGLEWWRDDASNWDAGEREPSMIFRALEELVNDAPKTHSVRRPVIAMPASVAEPPLRKYETTPTVVPQRLHTLERLESEGQRLISQCGRRRHALLILITREITSAPMEFAVRALASPKNHLRPLWTVGIGDSRVAVAVWPGDLHQDDLMRDGASMQRTPPVLIVCGSIAPAIEKAPPGLRGIVSASALFALCRWARHRPEDVDVVRLSFLHDGAVLRNAAQVFTLAGAKPEETRE